MGRLLDAIMDLLFLAGVVWTISKSVRGFLGGTHKGVRGAQNANPKRSAKTVQGRMVRDPVCGTFVSTEVSHRLSQGGEVLHFCSQECLETYEKKMAKV
ncbi:MAG: hypothetical protein P8Z30_13455 [Acidobacteriota bacterium]